MTHASVQQRATQPRALPEIVVDRIWRFFCSVRAAVVEIAILAVLVLAGTLRGSSVPQSIADVLPITAPVIDRWYAWDVFRSLPFAGILTLLAVAIAVCTINRAPGIWQPSPIPRSPRRMVFCGTPKRRPFSGLAFRLTRSLVS